jgi:hypothetical protein
MPSLFLILIDLVVIAAFAFAVRWFFTKDNRRQQQRASLSSSNRRLSMTPVAASSSRDQRTAPSTNQDSSMLTDSPRQNVRNVTNLAVRQQPMSSNTNFGGFDSSTAKHQIANSNVRNGSFAYFAEKSHILFVCMPIQLTPSSTPTAPPSSSVSSSQLINNQPLNRVLYEIFSGFCVALRFILQFKYIEKSHGSHDAANQCFVVVFVGDVVRTDGNFDSDADFNGPLPWQQQRQQRRRRQRSASATTASRFERNVHQSAAQPTSTATTFIKEAYARRQPNARTTHVVSSVVESGVLCFADQSPVEGLLLLSIV